MEASSFSNSKCLFISLTIEFVKEIFPVQFIAFHMFVYFLLLSLNIYLIMITTQSHIHLRYRYTAYIWIRPYIREHSKYMLTVFWLYFSHMLTVFSHILDVYYRISAMFDVFPIHIFRFCNRSVTSVHFMVRMFYHMLTVFSHILDVYYCISTIFDVFQIHIFRFCIGSVKVSVHLYGMYDFYYLIQYFQQLNTITYADIDILFVFKRMAYFSASFIQYISSCTVELCACSVRCKGNHTTAVLQPGY